MQQGCDCNCHHSPGKIIGGTILGLIAVFLIVIIASWSTQIITPESHRSVNAVVTNKGESFNVNGQASIETVPDEAQISLGVQAQATTVKSAQDQINTVINSLTESLKQLGIDGSDIRTTGYSISPNYDWSDSSRGQITGYNAGTSVTVTLHDFNILNQAIDAATTAGANQINGINFTLSKAKREEVRKEARQIAIEDAKKNAAELSGLTGMQLGRIIDVQESTDSNITPLNFRSNVMEDKAVLTGGSTSVEPGSTTFQYSVTLSYQTL